MPELPEAETVRRQLEPQIVGQRIARAWARLPRITQPSVEEFIETLTGARIVGAKRRGKQIYFPLDNGAHLLVHLGMTGRLHVEPREYSQGENAPRATAPDAENAILHDAEFDAETLPRHVHAALLFEDGRRLIFTDPRTFGALGVARDLPFLREMGPEPLDENFDEKALAENLSRRATPLKSALLNQKIVAGLGNIYADEVCFLARVHPATRASDVSTRKLREVVSHMKPVLQRAIEARGATLKDGGYQDVFGVFGSFVPEVYGRAGEPCNVCGTSIVRDVLGNGKAARSYHFCPRCQKRKRPTMSDE